MQRFFRAYRQGLKMECAPFCQWPSIHPHPHFRGFSEGPGPPGQVQDTRTTSRTTRTTPRTTRTTRRVVLVILFVVLVVLEVVLVVLEMILVWFRRSWRSLGAKWHPLKRTLQCRRLEKR